jgi:hypothetical protein
MAICEHCGKPLTCADHGAPKSDGLNLVQQCPKKVAVWILVKDDAGQGLPGFEVKCAGATKKTDKAGYAYFENLDPAKYTAEITLPEPAADKPRLYKKLEQTSQSDDVKEGQVKLFRFALVRLAFLKVKIVRADDESVFIPDIKVDVENSTDKRSSRRRPVTTPSPCPTTRSKLPNTRSHFHSPRTRPSRSIVTSAKVGARRSSWPMVTPRKSYSSSSRSSGSI